MYIRSNKSCVNVRRSSLVLGLFCITSLIRIVDFAEGTDDLKDGITDFTPVSFASDENTDIGLVQFAMQTEAISIADDDEEEETVEEDKSFVQKLKDLF